MVKSVSAKLTKAPKNHSIIRNIYLYLVAVIGLVTFIVGAVGMIDNVLQNYVFQVKNDLYVETIQGEMCSQPYVDRTDAEGKRMINPTPTEIATCVETQKVQQQQNRLDMIGQQFSSSIAEMVIGLPLWLFHWLIIQKEYRHKKIED